MKYFKTQDLVVLGQMCLSGVFQGFAYLGFIVAVIWIYSIANEIVNILQVCECILAYLTKQKLRNIIELHFCSITVKVK